MLIDHAEFERNLYKLEMMKNSTNKKHKKDALRLDTEGSERKKQISRMMSKRQ